MFAYLLIFAIGVLRVNRGFSEIVNTAQGPVNGTILYSRNNKPFHAFFGIPYAAPPVGPLRFQSPKEPPSWEDLRPAIQKPTSCLQPASFINPKTQFIGSEDCLYINIFTPELNPVKRIPVIVFIHGGAYHMGSSTAKGPHFFMDTRVVFVSFNHRHGIFGYLSSGDNIIPGNYGLKDQISALKWIRKNIEFFGGDPNSVTLLGQSSGASCVHFLTQSKQSKGLFHKAILQSGSALSYWSYYEKSYTNYTFVDLAKRVKCDSNNTEEILSCLRQLPADTLIEAEHTFLAEKRIVIKFRPSIEDQTDINAVIDQDPHDFQYTNTDIPWIIGFNSAEGLIDASWYFKVHATQKTITDVNNELNDMMPYFLHYKYNARPELLPVVTEILKRFYFETGFMTITEDDEQGFCDLISDIVFTMPIIETIKNYPGKKFVYYYDYRNTITTPEIVLNYSKPSLGASHGDDLLSLLSTPSSHKLNAADKKLSEQMVTYWVNFAYTGDPNADSPVATKWEPTTSKIIDYLLISNDGFKMKAGLLQDRYRFWKTLRVGSTKPSNSSSEAESEIFRRNSTNCLTCSHFLHIVFVLILSQNVIVASWQ